MGNCVSERQRILNKGSFSKKQTRQSYSSAIDTSASSKTMMITPQYLDYLDYKCQKNLDEKRKTQVIKKYTTHYVRKNTSLEINKNSQIIQFEITQHWSGNNKNYSEKQKVNKYKTFS